ncbi:MAG: glycoside hydrolase family 3 C-terminal domain-containing protein [Lachnospiraceae bacterium]|nr:glycoside hydrolase family 3 C-terminal domain-containing protein [Lachnospiraceae bacterium]
MMKKISRRDFLRGSAAGVVGVALSGFIGGSAVLAEEESAYGTAEGDNTTFPDVYPEESRVIYSDEELDELIDAIMNTMTYEEKLDFVSGNDAGETPYGFGTGGWLGLSRLGIPVMRSYDGPMGVISKNGLETSKPSSELSLASSWDTDLAYDYGVLNGTENKASSGSMQLGIQLDNARDLFFGRTRDTMGEDWFLTGTLGAAEAQGIQSENVIAVLKHMTGYVDNSNPGTPSYTHVDEQTLHENMLSGFEMAVKDGGALSIMSSYNRVDGDWYLNENVVETQAASNSYLQYTVARDMWGWEGFFVTDWGGNQQYSLNKGTDMETPSASQNTAEAIDASIQAGETTMDQLETACRHILYGVGSIGYLGLVEYADYVDADGNRYVKQESGRADAIELPASLTGDERTALLDSNNEIALQSAEDGAVLLKNENSVLPLSEASGSIAMIGEAAAYAFLGHYSESSQGTLAPTSSPYEELSKQLTNNQVDVFVGIDEFGTTVPAENLFVDAEATANGVVRTDNASGTTVTDAEINFLTNSKTYFNAEDGTAFTNGESYTLETYLKPDEDGVYTLIIGGIGGTTEATIEIDGETIDIASSTDTDFPTSAAVYSPTGYNVTSGSLYEKEEETEAIQTEAVETEAVQTEAVQVEGSEAGATDTEAETEDPTNGGAFGDFGGMFAGWGGGSASYNQFTLKAGQTYKITITATANSELKDMQLCLNWKTPTQDDDNYAAAVQASKDYDTVVVTVFHRETNDTLSLDDSDQEQLLTDVIAAAKEAGKRIVVVGYLGVPIDVSAWIDDVDAFLQMWLPGQAGGLATANLLSGAVNPSGKLPVTWPMTASDAQTDGLPETGSEIEIEEGIFMGYRWYDQSDIEPRYDFGYGLSYTTFEYSDLSVTESADDGEDYGYDVTFTVTNTGDMTGSETAQVYLGAAEVPENIMIAKYQLAGFTKVKELAPGESNTVTVHIDQRSLSYWDINVADDNLYVRADGTQDKWTVATGDRTIYVGAASDNLLLSETVTIA